IMRSALKKGQFCQVTLRNYRKDGRLFWNELTMTPVRDDLGKLTHFIGVQNDVTVRKNEELLKDDIQRILEKIANDVQLPMIANTIVETVEGHLKGCKASILLLDKQLGTLHKLAAPNLPKEYNIAIEGTKIGAKAGSCGTAAFIKKEVIAEDIATDARWKNHKERALRYKLRSCWSFPIFSAGKEVLGTFAIYFDHKRKPQQTEKEILANLTHLASVAIEQHIINRELKESRAQLEQYAQKLEAKVLERTKEVTATVQKLVEANLSLEDQIQTTRAAENKAMASQALFAAIAQNFPKGVISVFNSDLEFVYLEGEELKKFKFNKNDFEGRKVDDAPVLSKELKERIKGDIKKTLLGEHLSFEMTYGKEDYSVNSIPLLADKNITWALFVHTNITEQKKVQLELTNALQSEQELNELKSRFISMASHEFRTPLSAILSSAILIGKQNEPGKEEKREKYIKQIKSNVRNLTVILNDFLSLSKMEEGKTAVQYEHFDLVLLAKTVIDEIETSQKEGQTLVLEHSEPNISVFMDSKLMRHILINLISNAIKYSDENTQIDIGISTEKNRVLLHVADQGMGIPLEEQNNLFERFFRAKNATNVQGTGLGLHIVKQYSELMGGKVQFKSEEGKGTIFYVDFPLDDNSR
ncbi:MAG: ATP-binding protein, partial [Flavobacteriaceae bacterium]